MSTRRILRGCLAAIAMALPLSLFGQDTVLGPNLAANPSFENCSRGARLPDHWVGDPAVYSICRDVARSGPLSLKYVNHDQNRYCLATQKIELKPGQKYRVSAWVKTERLEGRESGATVCMEWRDNAGNWIGGVYPTGVKGTSDWKHIQGEVRTPKGAASFTLTCYVRERMTGTAWFDDVEVVRVAEKPLRSTLVSPGYRGRLTATGPDSIRVHLEANLLDYDLKGGQLSVAASLTDASGKAVPFSGRTDGQPVVRRGVFEKATEAELSYPVRNLPAGSYQLTVQLLGPDDRQMQSITYPLVRMPDDFRPKCMIDGHGRVILDSKPFFPLGMYWGTIKEDELQEFSKSNFNCLMAYHPPSREQMDLAQRYGLKVIYSIKDWYYGSEGCPADIKSRADEEGKVRQRVREFRTHPALLAWYLNDELSQSYMEQLNAHERWVGQEDPDHPTWVVLYQVNQVRDYLDSFDVIGTDPYPIGRSGASMAASWTAQTRRQVRGARPLWQVPQVFNWANYHEKDAKPGYRTPTFDEMRSMAWQCIAEGANGLVFYSWFDIRRNKDVPFDVQWERLRKIAAEIHRWAPILLSVDRVPAVAVEAPGWLHWTARSASGKLHIFAVSDGDGEGKVRVRLPGVPKRVHVVGDSRKLRVADAGFEDELPRLTLAVYEIEL